MERPFRRHEIVDSQRSKNLMPQSPAILQPLLATGGHGRRSQLPIYEPTHHRRSFLLGKDTLREPSFPGRIGGSARFNARATSGNEQRKDGDQCRST
jgi:hypothetical protein